MTPAAARAPVRERSGRVARARARDGRAPLRRPRGSSNPRRRPESAGSPLYHRSHAGRPAHSGRHASPAHRDSALGAARRAATAARPGVDRGRGGQSRRLSLPRRAADRAAPQPARARAWEGVDPARPGSRDRVSDVRRCGGSCGHRSCDSRGATNAPRESSGRRLLYGRVRTPKGNGGCTRPHARAVVARCEPSAAHPHREARHEVPRLDRDEGRREVHDEGAQLGGRRGSRSGRPAVQHRARDRRVDLHAARHATARRGRRPAVPAATRKHAVDRAHGAGARELREGPTRALADHRRRAQASASGYSTSSGCCPAAGATRSSSACGPASPSSSPTSGRGSARYRRSCTHSCRTRSPRCGLHCSSSASSNSRATSSCRR